MDMWDGRSKKIGAIFPKEIATEKENCIAQNIYDRICNLYHREKWDIEDFKAFRKAIASKAQADLPEYEELILEILNLSPKKVDKELRMLDTLYECHILEERIKIEEDPNVLYKIKSREPNKGDIVLIAQMVSGKMRQFIANYITDKISMLTRSGEPIETICDAIQEQLKDEKSNLHQALKNDYRQRFSYLRAHPVLEEFYSETEEKIIERALEVIRKEKTKAKKAEMDFLDSYTKDTICSIQALRQQQERKSGRGKGFGIWHD